MRPVYFQALLLAVSLLALGCGPPSDRALLSSFTKNRARLEALVDSVMNDPSFAKFIEADGVSDGVQAYGLDPAEFQKYKVTLRRAGVLEIYDNRKWDGEVWFICHVPTIGHSSVIKGYAYRIERAGLEGRFRGRAVDSLDGWSRQSSTGYRWIEKGWYLVVSPY